MIHQFSVTLDPIGEYASEKIRAAAQTCYTASPPTLERLLETERPTVPDLRNSGHLTVFMHQLLTFRIENLPVGMFTFPLHLYSPFYNSSQRSGRYSKMFESFDQDYVRSYVTTYWPEQTPQEVDEILDYCGKCKAFYDAHIEELTQKALGNLILERPNGKHSLESAKKIAQEQLRVALPVIWPSGAMYSITLASFLSLYTCAWDPQLVALTETMKQELLKQVPGLASLFVRQPYDDWAVEFEWGEPTVFTEPQVQDVRVIRGRDIVVPSRQETHPTNLLTMHPKFAINGETKVQMWAKCSVVTFGQMERHRTAKRYSWRILANEIYCPPLLVGLEKELIDIVEAYQDLAIFPSLRQILAPLGAAICWDWEMDLNCLIHFQLDRTCWCAQEEAYQIACQLAAGIEKDLPEINSLPPCLNGGACGQGARYCGRQIEADIQSGRFFPKRQV